jgi:hypothetical protein
VLLQIFQIDSKMTGSLVVKEMPDNRVTARGASTFLPALTFAPPFITQIVAVS